jgi:hypothetical protein
VLLASGQGTAASSLRTGLGAYVTTGMKSPITVAGLTYAVASTTDLTARTDILPAAATHYEAVTALAAFIAANPSQRDAVQVVAAHEVAA